MDWRWHCKGRIGRHRIWSSEFNGGHSWGRRSSNGCDSEGGVGLEALEIGLLLFKDLARDVLLILADAFDTGGVATHQNYQQSRANRIGKRRLDKDGRWKFLTATFETFGEFKGPLTTKPSRATEHTQNHIT